MKQIKFFDIQWEIDDSDIDLPENVEVIVNADFDVDNDGADFLSDEFGYLVLSFKYVV
jgi:hypothetical protein